MTTPAAPAPADSVLPPGRIDTVHRTPRRVPVRPVPFVGAPSASPAIGAATPAAAPTHGAGASAGALAPLPTAVGHSPRQQRRVARQVIDGMEPVFDQAHAATVRAFEDSRDEPVTADATQATVPRVSNTFNVNVAVGANQDPAADAGALEDALVELLRSAARRQGLEV